MKKTQQHTKKIKKIHIKKWATTLMLLFFAMTILFQKDIPKAELQFVRHIDETFLHQAPKAQRDYLFQDETWQATYQWTLSWTAQQLSWEKTILWETQEIENIIQELNTTATNLYTGNITTGNITTGNIMTGTLDCITPWKETIKHKDFVLAYQQRKDVNTMCNIEKRICMSGTLLWSFEQRSCKENLIYEYRKAEVISYNQKVLNEYIQPQQPINEWANFSTQGKINEELEGKTNRDSTNSKPTTTTTTTVNQTIFAKKTCTTPRWQKIEHGQFTKAYKSANGFKDQPCEVELRACIDGTLKWWYTQNACTYKNILYKEYLQSQTTNAKKTFFIFERIKSIKK